MNNDYNKKLKVFARENRKTGTRAEIKLWVELLRNKQLLDYPFLRQRPIGNYIADFFSKDLKLIIEVDGLTHQWDTKNKDAKRDKELGEMGYSTLRFSDDEVMNDLENVKRTIEKFIWDFEESHPPAPFKGGLDL